MKQRNSRMVINNRKTKRKSFYDFSDKLFYVSIENDQDDDMSKMAADELIRLQSNLTAVDNEVNKCCSMR